MTNLPASIESRLCALPEGLRRHIERTRQVGHKLANRHGINTEKVDLACAVHDLARSLKSDDFLQAVKGSDLQPHPVELQVPMLLHGSIAALWLKRENDYDDSEVLEAITYHTTGRKDMGPVAKIVFLADKLDPWKVERCSELEEVMLLAQQDLDQALLTYLNITLKRLIQRGDLVHPESIELRNHLIMNR